MRNADLNFNEEGLLAIPVQSADFEDKESGQLQLQTFKNELRQHASIKSVASSSHIPGRWSGWFTFVYPTDRDDSQRLRQRYAVIDENFFETYGVKFLFGRNFSAQLASDVNDAVILNEAALQDIGWHDADNKQVRVGGMISKVIGVVENYHYESVAEKVAPVVHRYGGSDHSRHRYVSVKLHGGDLPATLDYVREKWQQLAPDRAFDYFFIDDNFKRLYENESRLSTVTGMFTALAVIVACLGLFALASLIITQRTKEIGVRKALGSSVSGIVVLLSRSFVKLVLVAFVIAAPLSYWLAELWLSDFASRMKLQPWLFIVAGGTAVGVAVLSVCYQAIKAAEVNPVDALRYE